MSEHYFSENPTSPKERGLIRTRLRGADFEFETSSGVFSHKRVDSGTRLLVETMQLPTKGKILDLGCGYGVIGIVAAKLNPSLEVWMTDINCHATILADANSRHNGAKTIVMQGSLYEPIEDLKFDLIVTNPPISAGIEATVKPIITGAPTHLVEGGALQLVVQSNKGGRTLFNILKEAFGNIEVKAKGGGFRVFSVQNKL